MLIKPFFILLGSFSLGIGVLGVFLPGLPTTPFVLLSAALYVRSSPVLYRKLKEHRVLGQYMNITSEGISRKTKVFSIILMWMMILASALLAFSDWKWRIGLFILGLIGTWVKLRLPTKVESDQI